MPLTLFAAPFVFKRTREGIRRSPWGFVLSVVGVCILVGGVSAGGYKVSAVLVYTSSNVFSTISFLQKERLLREHGASAVMTNVWNAIFMVPLTFALLPAQSISWFGDVPLDKIGTALTDGCKCFAGMDVAGSSCSGAWASEMFFSVGTFVAGVFACVLVKYASSAFQWAAAALVVPLSNCVFALPILKRSDQQPVFWYTGVGFVMVALGFAVYGYGEHLQACALKRHEEENESAHAGLLTLLVDDANDDIKLQHA